MVTETSDSIALRVFAAHVPSENGIDMLAHHLCLTEVGPRTWNQDDTVTVRVADASMLPPLVVRMIAGRRLALRRSREVTRS